MNFSIFRVYKSITIFSETGKRYFESLDSESISGRLLTTVKCNKTQCFNVVWRRRDSRIESGDSTHQGLNTSGDLTHRVYKYTNREINEHAIKYGYFYERLGLYKGKYIKGEELDDGATIIKGEVISLQGAEMRNRFLSPYNFIICHKNSPLMSREFEIPSDKYFEKIINGKMTPEEFFEIIIPFAKKKGNSRY